MELLTVKEFASVVKLNPMTVYRLVKQNKLPHAMVGGQIRILMDLVEEKWRALLS